MCLPCLCSPILPSEGMYGYLALLGMSLLKSTKVPGGECDAEIKLHKYTGFDHAKP